MVRDKEKGDGLLKRTVSNEQIQQIQQLAKTIRYGSITLVFQDGILVQIDKNEKIRIH